MTTDNQKGSHKPPAGLQLPIDRIGVLTAIAGLVYVSLQALGKLVEIIQLLF